MGWTTTILGYIGSSTNYSVTNVNNNYNFILSMMDLLPEDQRDELIDKMILHLGRTFYKNFRKYVIDKLPNSEHLQVINRHV